MTETTQEATTPAAKHSYVREAIYIFVILGYVAYCLFMGNFTVLNVLIFIAVTMAIWLPDWA